jgi:hypothetical protein
VVKRREECLPIAAERSSVVPAGRLFRSRIWKNRQQRQTRFRQQTHHDEMNLIVAPVACAVVEVASDTDRTAASGSCGGGDLLAGVSGIDCCTSKTETDQSSHSHDARVCMQFSAPMDDASSRAATPGLKIEFSAQAQPVHSGPRKFMRRHNKTNGGR